MNMNDSAVKEEISLAFIKAIIAAVKYNYHTPNRDYGTDLNITPVDLVGGNYIDGGVILSIQMKSTINLKKEQNIVKFDLDHSDYLRMKHVQVGRKKVLIVLDLPRNSKSWVISSPNFLKLQKTAYYIFNDEIPEWPPQNTTRFRISIPIANKFDLIKAKMIFDEERERINQL